MAEVYITSKDLLETLKKFDPNFTSQDLIDLEQFIDSDPKDEWELNEGKDYRIAVKKTGLREYTASGAYALVKCLDSKKKPGLFDFIKEFIQRTKSNVNRAFVGKKVLDNCSSLMSRRNQFWISRSDLISIFGTNSQTLNRMMEEAKNNQTSLIQGKDYDNFSTPKGLYFSMDGVYKLSKTFGAVLTQKNRKEWCVEVGSVIQPQVRDIVNQIMEREKNIQKAMTSARKRDKDRCQVTQSKKDKVNQLKLASHHLYSQNTYPYLADRADNILTITCDVHDQFHIDYMGGKDKACTIDDFASFVQKYYPSNNKVVIWLANQRLVLGNPQPIDLKKPPHVLYLPASRFK